MQINVRGLFLRTKVCDGQHLGLAHPQGVYLITEEASKRTERTRGTR